MTAVSLDDLMQYGIEHAQRIVRLGKELMPMVTIAAGEQHIVVAVPDYGDHNAKPVIREMLRTKMAELNAHAYCFIMEAWFTEFERGKGETDPRAKDPDYLPSEDPRRRECVCVMGVSLKGERRSMILEIKRSKNGRVDFVDMTKDFPPDGILEGPMLELLPKTTVQ